MFSIIQKNIADIHLSLGQYENAERQMRYVIDLDPGFAPAYVGMSELMAAAGRMDEAVQWTRQSMEMDPGRLVLNLALLWTYMDLGDTEAMLDLRSQMAEINPDHLFTGFIDMLHAMYEGNLAASLESAKWVNQRMGRQVFFQRIFGFLNNMNGQYDEARERFEVSDPNFFNRELWRTALEDEPSMGCMIGWILIQTDDIEMGNALMDQTEAYLTEELPNYLDHSDRYGVDACYAARGRLDEALDAIETWVSHHHYQQWFFVRKHPQWEPLWGHPRFEAAMQQIINDMAEQRANLARLEEQGP
jgi:tetratricopeptide (TPR) repeat protein